MANKGKVYSGRGELLIEYEYEGALIPVPIVNFKDGTVRIPGAKNIRLSERLIAEELEGSFELFWKEYPKKRSKGQARRAWKKIKPDNELFNRIMSALIAAKKSREWARQDGEFMPYPATWLNAEGWEDEIVPAQPKPLTRKEKMRKALMEE
jgi:hypothetical protein